MTAIHNYWLMPDVYKNPPVVLDPYIASYGEYIGPVRAGKSAALLALFAIMPSVNYWSDCTGARVYSIVNADTGEFLITYTPCTNSVGVTGGGDTQYATATLTLA